MEKSKGSSNKISKKIIIGVVVFIAIILIGLICALVVVGGSKNNEKKLETSIVEMGREFYENFYYEQIGSSSDERNSLLSKFTDIGIKVDLDNLGRYKNGEFKEKISEFKNEKTDEKCNSTNTKVIIYPKSPYGKTDYTIKAELDCGFEKENEK